MGNAASQHTDLPNGARITTSALNVPTLNNDDPSLRDRQRSREQNITETLLSSPRRRRIRHNDENTPPTTFVAQTRASSRASGGTTPLRPIQNTVFPGFGLATPPATQGLRAASAHQRDSETFLTAPSSVPDQCTAATLSRRAQAQRDRRARERAQRQCEAQNCEHGRNPSRSHIRATEPLTPPATQPRNIVRAPASVEPLTPPITQLPNAVRERSLAEPSTSLMTQPANAARERVSEIGIMTPPQTQSHPTPSLAVGGGGARLQQSVAEAAAGLFMAARRPYREPESRHDLGRMDVACTHCGALHWADERVNRSRRTATPEFGMCCDHGKVCLPALPPPPPILQGLLEANDAQAQEFRHNIRAYNMALAFTSLGVREDNSINRRANRSMGGSAWVFRIQGQLYHRSGALEAGEGRAPSYSQLYVYDPQAALQQRMLRNNTLRRDTMEGLQNMLSLTHRYAAVFKHAFEIIREHEQDGTGVSDVEVRLRAQNPPPGDHPRRYNLPTADEVAMVLPGDGSEADPRDIILRRRLPQGTGLYRIHEGHPAYSPLHYVLLFPFGNHGWQEELSLRDPTTGQPTEHRLTQTRFASYHIQVRPGQYSTLLRGGRLFQQWLVDMWACADQYRLRFLQKHQSEIRASLYSGLEDAVAGDGEANLHQLGLRTILPSSYMGGPRHMQQRFQDAMAIARRFRKVDIFMTVTANPRWPEIERELLPGQTVYDRPDLVARVFQLKKQAILDDIRKHGIFGRTVAHVYTIEFQKRGLPHMHILIFLADGQKLLSPEDIDACISAEWPDPDTQPKLFETVMSCMVHGPCGELNPYAPCMENGRCTKFYPKVFQPFTRMDEDGFPLYRRRDDGRTFLVGRTQTNPGWYLDNRWIVPYTPYLSAKYDCHINVECAVMLRSVKYPFKYIHKGGDRARVEVENDEIKTFLEGRYIAAAEAVWRLLHFGIHEQKPNVVRLQVHLPGQHMVRYNPNEDPRIVLQRARNERTTLTGFFAANADPGILGIEARKYTYQEFPEHFVWDTPRARKRWALRASEVRRLGLGNTSTASRRRRELNDDDNDVNDDDRSKNASAIGRMYFVSPSAGERFYLRTLLTVVKGAISFADLRQYQGILHPTFRDACLARGLLEDDGEWRACLSEAAVMQTGTRLRHLFATLLLFCHPSQPERLWTEFRHHICDDLHHRLLLMGHANATDEDVYDYGLYLLDQILGQSGRSLREFEMMPRWSRQWGNITENPLIAEQLAYDADTERTQAETRIQQLNEDQRAAFDAIIASVDDDAGHTFFLDGPGGTGKTFIYNTLCHYVRGRAWIVICVASCGISALLMNGGRTAHSRFKIPIDGLTEGSVCNIRKESDLAALLRVTRLILWDEALMQHRWTHEALDHSLRDIRDCDAPFGGITVVFGGDFQQTLPVVPKGTQAEIIAASLPRSYLWNHIQSDSTDRVLRLRQNMRLDVGHGEAEFAQWLLKIGHGQDVAPDGTVAIPDSMRCESLASLTDFIYPGLDGLIPPPVYFLERTILAARNSDVDDLNEMLLARMPGEVQTFISADSIENEDGSQTERANEIPVEYLRTLNAPGLPPGELSIKPGCPLILLRNLAPARGLCNGSRMILRRASGRVLEVELIGGQFHGTVAFIPRITLTPSGKDGEFAFTLRRRQFPVRLAFSMTINKAQGQSVRYVGLDLREPVFSHGQLYVALSRATSRNRIKVLLPATATESRTTNIVYPEILMD